MVSRERRSNARFFVPGPGDKRPELNPGLVDRFRREMSRLAPDSQLLPLGLLGFNAMYFRDDTFIHVIRRSSTAETSVAVGQDWDQISLRTELIPPTGREGTTRYYWETAYVQNHDEYPATVHKYHKLLIGKRRSGQYLSRLREEEGLTPNFFVPKDFLVEEATQLPRKSFIRQVLISHRLVPVMNKGKLALVYHKTPDDFYPQIKEVFSAELETLLDWVRYIDPTLHRFKESSQPNINEEEGAFDLD